ncbi:MAG TPA: DNA methyltransferase, partial [Chthonomonadales bacterium]|nr:DNA methyltransferase [Chthonomonadales bacterium]
MLDHEVRLHFPTRCRCGEPLPEGPRSALSEAVRHLSEWFGGVSIVRAQGGWDLPDKRPASGAAAPIEAPVTDRIEASASVRALKEHRVALQRLAVRIADEMSQDAVALAIDGDMAFYDRADPSAPCVHRRAAAQALPSAAPPRPRPARTGLERMKALQAALDGLRSLDVVRKVFVELLGYDRRDEALPWLGWPGSARAGLAEPPRLVAGAASGFPVVYLRLADNRLYRVAERQAIEQIVKDRAGDSAGLFVVSNAAGDAWELVNVKRDPAGARGRVLRRMPIGRGDGARTATERLWRVNLDGRESLPAPDVHRLHDEAFDVEAVTREFFREYSRVFEQVEETVENVRGDKRLFAQTLLNRLMFVHFVARKGWLRYKGSADYLAALWRGRAGHTGFYNGHLRQLFFAALNNPQAQNLNRHNRALHALVGDVPYLNGGLFEEGPQDAQGEVVPDEALDLIINGLFGRFNFTVMESTPLDEEVAVDPEMLGMVFERLVTGRHESGSYYTPKPIVSFMCREALKGYLRNRCPHESEEALAAFVDRHDPAGIRNGEAVLDSLRNVTVCDPACGSGAYLLGMLHELMDLRACLFAARSLDPVQAYDRKLEIIQRNLYGVDLDPFAVNVARLRLWLSLAVEFDGVTPEPLPNLDFKIEEGDSLLAPDPQRGDEPDMYRQAMIDDFEAKKRDYADPRWTGNKPALKKE